MHDHARDLLGEAVLQLKTTVTPLPQPGLTALERQGPEAGMQVDSGGISPK